MTKGPWMQESNIVLGDYKPRDYQIDFEKNMFNGKRRAFLLYHRRAGKDFSCFMFTIYCALRDVPGVYFYIFPSYTQGKKVIWDGIDESGNRLLDYIPKALIDGKPNQTEMKLRFINGSIIQIIGSDNPDAIRGTNPKGVVLSEYALQDPRIWTEVLSPILVKNKGWAIFNTTPQGRNHAYDLWDNAQNSPYWFCQKLTVDDTGLISKEEIERERQEGRSEEIIQQEYYCSFDRGVDGSYYGRLIAKMRLEDRICNVHYEPRSSVNTYWDIGYGDSTAIVFGQYVGSEFRVIDYYEAHGESIAHYVKYVNEKPYVYDMHYFPHDAGSGSIHSGNTLQKVAQDLGLKNTVLPRDDFEVGIEAARSLLAVCYIDQTKCKQLIRCLESYHKQFNDKMNVYSNTPVHDQFSHGCFISETLIDCIDGKKKIVDIQKGDLVLTPNGYKKVINKFEYESNDLINVKTTNSSFTCTKNHKIFTDKGLIYSDALRYNDMLYNNSFWSRKACQIFGFNLRTKNLGFRENFLLAKTKNKSFSMGITIDGMDSIIGVEKQVLTQTAVCIGQFGHFIKEKYRINTISITKMEILKIMKLKIWKSFQQVNIPLCIPHQKKEKNLELQLEKPWSMQKYGIDQKKEENGIVNMLKPINLDILNFLKHVHNVTKNILVKYITRNSVQIHVKPNHDIYQESIMKKGLAKSVTIISNVINILSKEHVVKIVPLNLQCKQKVYDFEVEDDHCYYANGILVSNSDAFRYCAMARIHYGKGSSIKVTPDSIKDMRRKFYGY